LNDANLEFKIKTARKFLDKIPESIPKNHAQQMKLEENASAFLFFASGVIEIVKRRINDTFGIFDKKNVFYMHGLRKNLANSGIQKKAKKAIADYFSVPKRIGTITNPNKISLWRLQALRNQAMHGNIIQISNGTLLFSYTVHGGENYEFVQKSKNPQKYFGQIFDDLVEFTERTLEICQTQAQAKSN
jgi:hypothetical protein